MQSSNSLMIEAQQHEKLEIFVSCRNLDDLDYITVTDSYLVVKLIENNRPEKVILKTKVYENNLNPNYAESALVDFVFQTKQYLIFQVYHQSSKPKLLGKVETSLGEIFGSPEHGIIRDLKNGNKSAGKLIARCEKRQQANKKQIALKLSGKGLPKMTWWYFFGGTKAFFRIFRKRQQDELLVYESQTVASHNPSWLQFKISERKLASNDPNKQLLVKIYHYSNDGNHQILGSVVFRMKQFENGANFDILNKQGKKAGTLVIDLFKSITQYQFGDYIQNRLQLALTTCIDFTGSNGPINDKQSLHYIGGKKKSLYEKALEAVTNILLDYDYDKLVPVYGFGAKVDHPKLSTQDEVSHCFPINCNIQDPSLYQTDQIIKEYRKILPYLQFQGPTLFSQILKQAIKQSKQYKQLETHYMILFILTDGEIHDQKEVIDLIIQCSTLPISVIIVGVGKGEFNMMHQLDDDNCQMVDSKGNKPQRDLVQFVEFKKFHNDGPDLAKEVLQELPRQVSQYFQLMEMSPNDVNKRHKIQDVERVKRFKENMANPYEK